MGNFTKSHSWQLSAIMILPILAMLLVVVVFLAACRIVREAAGSGNHFEKGRSGQTPGQSARSCCADRPSCRPIQPASFSKIPARLSALAGTMACIVQHLRKRRTMNNGVAAMNTIDARAGPCRLSLCDGSSLLARAFRRLETGA
jgi:hypothetical protein